MGRTTRVTLLVFISFTLIASVFIPMMLEVVSADGTVPSALTPYPTIRVDNDAELASLISTNSWKGTGTASDPYIIENLKINATEKQYGIYFGNVSKHLTVENCQVYSDNVSWPGYASLAGIALFNSTGLSLKNNNCSGNGYGIYLSSSSDNNTLTNNHCSGNGYGITIQDVASDDNLVSENICSGNGVGIQLLATRFNVVSNNDFDGNDIGLYGGLGVEIGFSDNNTISNNTCGGKQYGIGLFFSNDNSIFNNKCSGKEYGIYLETKSQNNQFVGNTGTVFIDPGTGSDTEGGGPGLNNAIAVSLIALMVLGMVIAYVMLDGRKHAP